MKFVLARPFDVIGALVWTAMVVIVSPIGVM